MINIILEPSLFLGGTLSLFMIFFYFLRFIGNQYITDWDIFLITLGIVSSIIIIIHGWRLDPILLFGQSLLILLCFSTSLTIVRQRQLIYILVEKTI